MPPFTMANWRPCSASNSCRTTSARLHFGRVELALDGQTDLAFLKAIQDVRLGDGFEAGIIDETDRGPFVDVKNDDHAVGLGGAVLHFQPNVLEILGIPQAPCSRADAASAVRVAVRVRMRVCRVSLGILRLPSKSMLSTNWGACAGAGAWPSQGEEQSAPGRPEARHRGRLRTRTPPRHTTTRVENLSAGSIPCVRPWQRSRPRPPETIFACSLPVPQDRLVGVGFPSG